MPLQGKVLKAKATGRSKTHQSTTKTHGSTDSDDAAASKPKKAPSGTGAWFLGVYVCGLRVPRLLLGP